MNRRVFILFCLALCLALPACRTESNEAYSQAMQQASESSQEEGSASEIDFDAPNYIGPPKKMIKEIDSIEGDQLSGELVIKSCYSNFELSLLAREFMSLHPNVTISFDVGIPDGEKMSLTNAELLLRRDSFYTQMRVELASGEGDYLLYRIDERFHIPQLSRSGLLEDLRPYFENDPDWDSSEYFQPVMDAFSCDGKQPVMPLSFMFDAVFLNRDALETVDVDADALTAVSVTQLLDWYEQAAENNDDMNLFFSSPDKKELFLIERPTYIDLNAGTSSFESPEFISFLERTQAINDEDPDLDYETERGVMDYGLFNEQIRFQKTGAMMDSAFAISPDMNEKYKDMASRCRPAFAVLERLTAYPLLHMNFPMEYVAGPFPMVSSSGMLGLTSKESFAIPSSCTNKELAWEFIKYCVSPRDEEWPDFTHLGYPGFVTCDIPVSKTNFQTLLELFIQKGYWGTITAYKFDSIDTESATKHLEEVLSLPLVNSGLYGIDVNEFLEDYYVHELGLAEQCAKNIQGRITIWLNE